MSNSRLVKVQRLRSSAGLVRCHRDLGTTPNIAPPSNLKNSVSMLYHFIFTCFFDNYIKRGNSVGIPVFYLLYIVLGYIRTIRKQLSSSEKRFIFTDDR